MNCYAIKSVVLLCSTFALCNVEFEKKVCDLSTTADEMIGMVESKQECILRCLNMNPEECRRINYFKKFQQCDMLVNSIANASSSVSEDDCVSYAIRTKAGTCLDGFTYFPGIQTCVMALNANVPWENGQSMCNALHPSSHLIIVNTLSEQKVISDFVYSNIPKFSNCFWDDKSALWTAGQRIDPSLETRFVWKPYPGVEIGLSPNAADLWNEGEPNFSNGVEACIQLWKFNRLNDVDCNALCCPMCQMEPDFVSA